MSDCTRVPLADWVGAPCPECGHTTLAHPGPTNPALDSCALCQITTNLAAQGAKLADVVARVDVIAPEPVALVDLEQLAVDAAELQLAQVPDYDQVTP